MIHGFLIPLCLLFVPWLVVRFVYPTPQTRKLPYRRHGFLLWVAALIWVLAILSPRFSLFDETTTFGLHTLGGVVTTLLFWYVTRAYGLRFNRWWHELAVLYFFVSGLGVANELLELVLTKLHLMAIEGSYFDTWWDLTANLCGAVTAWLFGRAVSRRSSR